MHWESFQRPEDTQWYFKLIEHNQLLIHHFECKFCFTTVKEGKYKLNVNLGRKKLKLLGQGRGEFKQFFNNLGKYKPKFTQGQIWWIRIGQENLNLSIAFYSPVISHLKPPPSQAAPC